MATIRQRKSTGNWEVVLKHKILGKPRYMTFDTELEAKSFALRSEDYLSKGVVPPWLKQGVKNQTIGELLRSYMNSYAYSAQDNTVLPKILRTHDGVLVVAADINWALAWVKELKRIDRLTPGSIRKRVGALSRCFDWCVLTGTLGTNPLKQLPRNYSAYAQDDGEPRIDVDRDRLMTEDERLTISKSLPNREWRLFFLMGYETAMRMREMYTLSVGQVDLKSRTVFLDKTKNGDKRQVPLSTPAYRHLRFYLKGRKKNDPLFSFWDGRESLARTTARLSHQWAKQMKDLKIEGLTFHDLRHYATTQLYLRTTMTDLQIAKITGHRTLRMLARYANLRGSDLVKHLW